MRIKDLYHFLSKEKPEAIVEISVDQVNQKFKANIKGVEATFNQDKKKYIEEQLQYHFECASIPLDFDSVLEEFPLEGYSLETTECYEKLEIKILRLLSLVESGVPYTCIAREPDLVIRIVKEINQGITSLLSSIGSDTEKMKKIQEYEIQRLKMGLELNRHELQREFTDNKNKVFLLKNEINELMSSLCHRGGGDIVEKIKKSYKEND